MLWCSISNFTPIGVQMPMLVGDARGRAPGACAACERRSGARVCTATTTNGSDDNYNRASAGEQRCVGCDLHRRDRYPTASGDANPRRGARQSRNGGVTQAREAGFGMGGCIAYPVPVERGLYRPIDDREAPTVDPVALRIGAVVAGTWMPAPGSATSRWRPPTATPRSTWR